MKDEKKVYILSETYKDNDPDEIGCYDSKQALARGFCEHIATDIIRQIPDGAMLDNKSMLNNAKIVADEIARLLPRLLDPEWDGADECRMGHSVFGYREMTLESAQTEIENG